MNTPKNGSYSITLYLVLVGVVSAIAAECSLSAASNAAEALTTSYEIDQGITATEADSVVANLEEALAKCGDNYLAFRLNYRIAIMYFRSNRMELSKARFQQIANNPECPEIVMVCSLNMIGQISRLMGNDKEALETFGQTVSLLSREFSLCTENATSAALKKLWILALFGKGEIFEVKGDYASAIVAYESLLEVLGKNRKDRFGQYVPLVNDRLSQLYLRQGDAGKYVESSQALTSDYPEYYRTGIIKWEIECVKFLKTIRASFDFSNDSFGAAAYVIAYLRDAQNVDSAQDMVEKLSGLSREYADSYSGILLCYHYAWLLDALGEEEKALDVLGQVSSIECVDTNGEYGRITTVETIQEYAKIQRAIILGERANYSEALQVLESLKTYQDRSHISELAESVSKSIKTLKREVRINEN